MSPGLLDDDNPWNDQKLPSNASTPGTGLAAGAALDDSRSRSAAGVKNGHAADAKAVVDDLDDARWRDQGPNGAAAPNAEAWAGGASSSSNGTRRPSAADSTSTTSLPRTSTDADTDARRASNGAMVPNGDGRTVLRRASSGRRPSGAVVELADGWTSTTSMHQTSRRPSQGSTSLASPSPTPAVADGWASAGSLQRSASTSASASWRSSNHDPGTAQPALDLWTSTTGTLKTSRRPSESTSIISSAPAPAPATTEAWASATSLQRSASTSTSASASGRRPSLSNGTSIFATPPPPAPSNQLRRRRGGHSHTRSQTIDVTHDVHPLSQPPSPTASPPPLPAPVTHTVLRTDSLAGVALKYGVTVAALRRGNGLWASDSIHLRTTLVIPSGDGLPLPSPPKTRHSRAHTTTTADRASAELPMRARRSIELPAAAHARASTDLADIAASFSLTLPRLRLSLDPAESDAEHEHELLPLSLSARRRKSRPQLSMSMTVPDGQKQPTTKQPSPIRGMVLPPRP